MHLQTQGRPVPELISKGGWRILSFLPTTALFLLSIIKPLSWPDPSPCGLDHLPCEPAGLCCIQSRSIYSLSTRSCAFPFSISTTTLAIAASAQLKMADFQNFGGSDEENIEIKKLNAEVVCPV